MQQHIPIVTKFSSTQHGHEIVSLLQDDTLSLSPQQMKAIDGITERHRFVDPPYMHRSGASYSWDAAPSIQTK